MFFLWIQRKGQALHGQHPFGLELECFAGGDKDDEVGGSRQQGGQESCRLQDVLEVVENEQQILLANSLLKRLQRGSAWA